MPSRSAHLPFALGLATFLTLTGCTSPPPPGQTLPGSDAEHDVVLGYQLRPEQAQPPAPPPAPEIEAPPEPTSHDEPRLVAGHPAHLRFAVSDTRRLWIGEDNTLHELERAVDTSRITDMVMDAEGVLWLLTANNELRVVRDEGIELAAPLPVEGATSIHAGAGHIVVLGGLPKSTELPPAESLGDSEYAALDEYAVMAVSPDGEHWSLRRRPEDDSEFDDLAISPDGSLMLMDGQEAECGGGYQERWRGHLSEPTWTSLSWPLDDTYGRVAATGGWSYAHGYGNCDDEGEGEMLCAVDEAGHGVAALEVGDGTYAITHTEGVTMLASGAGLWSLHGSKAERIGEGHEALFANSYPEMAISHTRVILVDGAQVYIGSAQGWTELSLD